jgi:hypothetical protein
MERSDPGWGGENPGLRFASSGLQICTLLNHNPGLGSDPLQQAQHRGFRHRNTSGRRSEIAARQMQKNRAAAPGDARRAVVIDLDNEIIEVVVAPEPVAALLAIEPDRLVVMAIPWVFAPAILGPDGANRQESPGPGVAVVAPP